MTLVRPLNPQERPLNILRRCLLQFGYTDQDKLEELSGKDNSFICRITFAENASPLTTVGCILFFFYSGLRSLPRVDTMSQSVGY